MSEKAEARDPGAERPDITDIMVNFVKAMEKKFGEISKSTQQKIESIVSQGDVHSEEYKKLMQCLEVRAKIMQNERNKLIRFEHASDPSKSCFMVTVNGKEEIFGGLRPTLAKAFFTYSYSVDPNENAECTDNKTAEYMGETFSFGAETREVFVDHDIMPAGRLLCKHGGKGNLHGIVVHDELEKFVNLLREGDTNDRMRNFFFAVSSNPNDYEYADSCTLHILHFLAENKMFPIASELPCYHEGLRIATKIDLVCLDTETMEICFVELKTGKTPHDVFMLGRECHMLKKSAALLPDTLYTRASLQLLVSIIIWQQMYDVVPHRAYVLYVSTANNQRKLQFYPIPKQFFNAEDPQDVTDNNGDALRKKIFVDFAKERARTLAEQRLKHHGRSNKTSSYTRARRISRK